MVTVKEMRIFLIVLSAVISVRAAALAAAATWAVSDSLERLVWAQGSADVGQIVKIARDFADEILAAPEAPKRVTSAVIGLYRKAEALEAESITPEDAGRLGRLYLMLSESYADSAKRYLERSVLQTDNEAERVALGNAFLYLGDPAAARREYLKVSKLLPQDPVLLVNLALAERFLGDTSSAYGRLRQVMARTTNPAALCSAMLAICDIQISSGDVSGARFQIMKVLERWPAHPAALIMLKQIDDRSAPQGARKVTTGKGERK